MFACEGARLSLRTVLFSLGNGSVDVHASVSLRLPRLLLLLLLCDEEGRQE